MKDLKVGIKEEQWIASRHNGPYFTDSHSRVHITKRLINKKYP